MTPLPGPVALLGGGVIGGGWAARFLLDGHDVRLFDPDPEAPRKVDEVLDNARRAVARLRLGPAPPEGTLTYACSVEAAVEGARFVQESAPEREDLKRRLLAAADAAAPPDAVIASSTSGLLPSRLAVDLHRPERLVVGHPFNPVYLLPLVEVCPGPRTTPETVERAARLYRGLGMQPLVLRREVDGFVADRLLEALWREALWLVHDDVATVEEIDDALRYGAGLRFAVMGMFLTYRIAGGEAGMRHFLAQFGPALRWPWTHLTDVPELTDAFLDRLVEQSDAQAAGASVRELERVRDDCLVGILHALRREGYGAGAVIERPDAERRGEAAAANGASGPLRLHRARVAPDWIDYNGHVTESRYLQLAADATDALLREVGVDAAYVAAGGSYYTVETHLSHLGQAYADEELAVSTQVLAADDKRLHLFHRVERPADGAVLATAEQMLLHVDARAGRAAPAAAPIRARVGSLAARHAGLPRPARAGRGIGAPPVRA